MNTATVLSSSLETLLGGGSPVVELPESWRAAIPGRIIVRHERALYAVRPDEACKTCNGSTAFRVVSGTERVVCGCVRGRLGVQAAPRLPGFRWAGAASPGAQASYDAETFRQKRIAEVTAERAAREAERDAEVGQLEAEVQRLAAHIEGIDDAERADQEERARLLRRIARLRTHAARADRLHELLGEAIEADGAALCPPVAWTSARQVRRALADNAVLYARMAEAAARRDHYEVAAARLRLHAGVLESSVDAIEERARRFAEERSGPVKQHARAVELRDRAVRRWDKRLRGFAQTLARLEAPAAG